MIEKTGRFKDARQRKEKDVDLACITVMVLT